MNFVSLEGRIADQRRLGRAVLIQCLPKMGSSALSQSLSGSCHEFEMESCLDLLDRWGERDFSLRRRSWLQDRVLRLHGQIDVCTSLILVTGDCSDDDLLDQGVTRFYLNRSFRPWLRSIVNWSFQFSAHPTRQRWVRAYRHFVQRTEPDLFVAMPRRLSSIRDFARFWTPVWLCAQALNAGRDVLLSDKTKLPSSANVSTFPDGYAERFNRAVPVFQPSSFSAEQHDVSIAQVRGWLAEACAPP